MQKLYTIVLEYRGGTYLSQVRADTPREALLMWARERKGGEEKGKLFRELRSYVRARAREDLPTAVNGCHNVWCFSAVLKNRLILAHLIATYKSS